MTVSKKQPVEVLDEVIRLELEWTEVNRKAAVGNTGLSVPSG